MAAAIIACRGLFDDNIGYAGGANSATATIYAGGVTSTQVDYPVLLHLDEAIGASGLLNELGTDYTRLYVKNGTTNLRVEVEYWNILECKLWVYVDTLTTAELVLTLTYDSTFAVNSEIALLDNTIGTDIE